MITMANYNQNIFIIIIIIIDTPNLNKVIVTGLIEEHISKIQPTRCNVFSIYLFL